LDKRKKLKEVEVDDIDLNAILHPKKAKKKKIFNNH